MEKTDPNKPAEAIVPAQPEQPSNTTEPVAPETQKSEDEGGIRNEFRKFFGAMYNEKPYTAVKIFKKIVQGRVKDKIDSMKKDVASQVVKTDDEAKKD